MTIVLVACAWLAGFCCFPVAMVLFSLWIESRRSDDEDDLSDWYGV